MNESLQLLAQKLGIAAAYKDSGLRASYHEINENTLRFFIRVLGYKADNDEEITQSLQKLERRRFQKVLENIYVCRQSMLKFDAVIKTKDCQNDFALTLKPYEKKEKQEVSFVVNVSDEKHGQYTKLQVEITNNLPIGYYELSFSCGENEYKSVLAVAPAQCFESPVLNDKKLFGYALQLYSLRSRKNWGVGDFSDLKEFVNICASSGGDVIGLNPINVFNHCFPEEASPYLSMSRLFLNPIYIDVSAVPEFKEDDIADKQDEIKALNASETILYGKVYNLKISVLQKLFARMKKDEKRLREFRQFCADKGEELENLSAFQCLYEDKWQNHWGGWRSWEKGFQNPHSAAIRKYKEQNRERMEFFCFLQFEAWRQFGIVGKEVKSQGLKIGIYRDLAVGVGRDSAELWSDEGAYLKDCGAGAPPDAFFPAGQKWNLGAFHPVELKERAYVPFIKILRAAMQSAGALRMDHVMSLMRLFVIPENKDGEGTYIYYNFEDMLNIVALESCLNRCMIVGESIGNVPEGFIEAITERNVYAMSVLWAQRYNAGWGDFMPPESYPEKVFASIGTHDMAPLKMWWFAYDIRLSRDLEIIKTDEEMYNAYHKREADRYKLLKSLDEAGVWPDDKHRGGDYLFGENYPEGLEEAAHRFMAKSKAKVVLIQPEDIFQVDKMQNLPGTDRDRHPNWRRKLPINLEDMRLSPLFQRNLTEIKKER